LQAEHDDPEEKAATPVLALSDGATLAPVSATLSLAGYAGDITAESGGFAVSCPRAMKRARPGLITTGLRCEPGGVKSVV
jgi:hypothetical protein